MEQTLQCASEADTAHQMAINAAEGAGVQQNWSVALDHLQHSARLGSSLAQAEFAALSGEWALARAILAGDASPSYRRPVSCSTIDLAKWLEPPHKSIVSEKPRIAAVENIAEAEMCDWLIARARPKLAHAGVLDRETGEKSYSEKRTNSACNFPGHESDLIIAVLRARIAAVTQTRVDTMESVAIFHYSPGQEFRPHFDIVLDPEAPNYAEKFAEGRQRVMTFLVCLNDDYQGGETEFPALGMRWKGRKGRALLFWNVESDGRLDQRTLHAGRPVIQGEKWLLSQWIGGRLPEAC